MPLYTIHERYTPSGGEPDLMLVKEGFSWPGFFWPVLWLPYLGDWLGLITYLALVGTLAVLGFLFLLPLAAAAVLLVGLLFLAALANDWRRWRLERRGYVTSGVIGAPDLGSAERRLFNGDWLQAYRERALAPAFRRVPLWPEAEADLDGPLPEAPAAGAPADGEPPPEPPGPRRRRRARPTRWIRRHGPRFRRHR